jgi:hypothetical protein
MYDEAGEIFDADAIPLSDDQMRALARIPYSDTGKSLLDAIDLFPLSCKLQTGLKQLALSYLSRDAIFAHNSDISTIMRAYDVSAITLDFLKSPKDAESKEIPPFMRNLRFLVASRASRTVGGETKDERTLQYNPTQRVEQIQRVEHAPLPREPEADEGGL